MFDAYKLGEGEYRLARQILDTPGTGGTGGDESFDMSVQGDKLQTTETNIQDEDNPPYGAAATGPPATEPPAPEPQAPGPPDYDDTQLNEAEQKSRLEETATEAARITAAEAEVEQERENDCRQMERDEADIESHRQDRE